MKSSAAARRYARALFGLAKEEDATARVREEIDSLAALFETSPQLREALLTPLQ